MIRTLACSLFALALTVAAEGSALAQEALAPAPAPSAPQTQAPTYPPQQLDQFLAPIALYPDPLLSQILMAATYPLDVVEAARWLQDPNNARLTGEALDAALQQQTWDPSVKSLVPFPQILQMMNSKLDWTQALGNAFLAQRDGVMDSVQRLRAQAKAAGTLRSTPQETVTMDGQDTLIEPTNPQTVYVPYYDPNAVYGGWNDPGYPPIYFPPPPDYGYVEGPGIYFGAGLGIIGGLWGWNHWDWRHHDIHIDPDRYNRINNPAIVRSGRPRVTGDTWQHDPAQRHGVPYGDPTVRQRYRPSTASPAASQSYRGFEPSAGQPEAPRPPVATHGSISERPFEPQRTEPARPAAPVVEARPEAPRAEAPAFSSFGNGAEVRAESQRGEASRGAMRAAAPEGHGGGPGGGRAGGGGHGGER